jgi:hypothetical protein
VEPFPLAFCPLGFQIDLDREARVVEQIPPGRPQAADGLQLTHLLGPDRADRHDAGVGQQPSEPSLVKACGDVAVEVVQP